ncbi:MAG: Ig-like domain-containing protein, partial [Lachnospiraceae bacterium]|nr:Ig-like domain-containing protein [Lachnospiraceae bacterium]
IASIKKEPATSAETLLYSIPEEQQDIATIDASGNLTANKMGKATVTVSSSGSGTSTTIEVNICNPITGVTITKTEANNTPTTISDKATIDVFQGEVLNLNFETQVSDPTQNSTDQLQFAVTTPAIATIGTPVVENNVVHLTVTASGTGSTPLTIKGTESNFTTTLTLRVKTALNSISIDEKDQKQTVSLGETKDLAKLVKSNPTNHNETLTWESNNTAVATVTEKGVVTALTPGTALITVYCHRTGKSAQITVTADNTITAATITPKVVGTKEKPFYPGASEAVSMSITKKKDAYPASDTGITWSSSNEQIVTVSGGSLTGATITAVKTGSANIIVKNASGKQLASIAVNVSQPTISLETTSVTLYTKIAKRKSYTIKPIINGNDKTVSYKVTKGSKYIKVNSKGKVTYKSKKKAGTGVITVTANGVSTTLSVTINKTIKKKLSVSNSAGELKKKTITVKKSVGTCSSRYTSSWTALKVTYKSSKKKVASIDSKGLIKLKKKGTTKITTTVDGYKMTYTLKVK